MRPIVATIRTSITPKRIVVFGMIAGYIAMHVFSLPRQDDHALAMFLVTLSSLALSITTLLLVPRDIRAAMPYLVLVLSYYLTITVRPYFLLLQDKGPAYPFAGSVPEIIAATWVGVLVQLAFFCFLVVIRIRSNIFYSGHSEPSTAIRLIPPVHRTLLFRHLFFALIILVPSLNIICTRLRIGFMGGAASTLPFRLGGIIVTLRAFTLVLALFLVQLAFQQRSRQDRVLSVLMFIVSVVWITITTSSRGVIIGSGLALIALHVFMASRINHRRIIRWLLMLIIISVSLFPFITAYRSVGTGRLNALVLSQVREQYTEAYVRDKVFSRTTMFYQVMTRFTGIETLIPILRTNVPSLGLRVTVDIVFHRKPFFLVREYYGQQILGFTEENPSQYTMGFMGEFMLIGGRAFVFFGCVVLLFVLRMVWGWALSAHWVTQPVLLAYIIFGPVLNLFTEGNIIPYLFTTGQGVIVPIVFFFTLEHFARRYRLHPYKRCVHGQHAETLLLSKGV